MLRVLREGESCATGPPVMPLAYTGAFEDIDGDKDARGLEGESAFRKASARLVMPSRSSSARFVLGFCIVRGLSRSGSCRRGDCEARWGKLAVVVV